MIKECGCYFSPTKVTSAQGSVLPASANSLKTTHPMMKKIAESSAMIPTVWILCYTALTDGTRTAPGAASLRMSFPT